ncbi:MAG: hypothetical protein R2815_09320 [Flavobacteriales bacterium]
MSFTSGDMKKVMDADFVQRNGRPDVVVTDRRAPAWTNQWCATCWNLLHRASFM